MDLVITSVSPTAPTFLLTGRASFVVMLTNSLFHLLADAIREFHPPQRKKVISTYGLNAVSSAIADLSDLSCTHEEADTLLLSHASHSLHHAYTKLIIHATDSVVVVLAIAVSIVLQHCEIWVAFGHGSKLRFIPCHLIAAKLSGCDTVSAFHTIGKKTAWAVW